jgi:hypothetical protein
MFNHNLDFTNWSPGEEMKSEINEGKTLDEEKGKWLCCVDMRFMVICQKR